jgi:hypothetical protein
MARSTMTCWKTMALRLWYLYCRRTITHNGILDLLEFFVILEYEQAVNIAIALRSLDSVP